MMKVAVFDTHSFDQTYLDQANQSKKFELAYFKARLDPQTAVLAKGAKVICCFVNDRLEEETLAKLKDLDVHLVALRAAGYNNVDLNAAAKLGIRVVRVPAYSPYAVAEYAVAMALTLNRKLHKAYNRVRESNFSLDGLVGFDLYQKKVGITGTGKIGTVLATIMKGFGTEVLAYDKNPNPELVQNKTVNYVSLNELYRSSDLISLHVPLLPSTRHMINAEAIDQMKSGVFLINTGRGALIDTNALIQGLKSGKIGAAALDVYEEEEGVFFQNLSNEILQDDQLARLLTFPNVLITSHQAFLTKEALTNIAETTLENISDFVEGRTLKNEVKADTHLGKTTSA